MRFISGPPIGQFTGKSHITLGTIYGGKVTQKISFDLIAHVGRGVRYDWKHIYEAFCTCRNCRRPTIFVLSDIGIIEGKKIRDTGLENVRESVNNYLEIEGFISTKDAASQEPPEFLPSEIESAFKEGATCLAVGCPNAAATMFRLCIDHATKSFLPKDETAGLNSKVRRDLGLRLPWLFDNHLLPDDLRELSHCIKEDGNDGAHAGSLEKEEAQDVMDFTVMLLERLYTAPERIKLAEKRRTERRNNAKGK